MLIMTVMVHLVHSGLLDHMPAKYLHFLILQGKIQNITVHWIISLRGGVTIISRSMPCEILIRLRILIMP